METKLSIHQVAELTGLSIDTLRYYERIRLLEPVSRATSGHRRYQQRDLDWIGLLINLRETGMPLAQMIHFGELRRQGDATAAERLLLLEQHQRSLEQQMQKLEHHMGELQQKIAHKKAFLAQRDEVSYASESNQVSGASEAVDVRAPNQGEEDAENFALEICVNLNKEEEKETVHGTE